MPGPSFAERHAAASASWERRRAIIAPYSVTEGALVDREAHARGMAFQAGFMAGHHAAQLDALPAPRWIGPEHVDLDAIAADPGRVWAVPAPDEPYGNLDRAEELIAAIERTRAIQRELKAAFARSELDGGARAALEHPLYLQAEERLAELHDRLMQLI